VHQATNKSIAVEHAHLVVKDISTLVIQPMLSVQLDKPTVTIVAVSVVLAVLGTVFALHANQGIL